MRDNFLSRGSFSILCLVVCHTCFHMAVAGQELPDLVEELDKSVGTIYCYEDKSAPTHSAHGSGWVLKPGIVVTNYHVIKGMKHFILRFPKQVDITAIRIEAVNERLDLALIRIPETNCPPSIPIATTLPRVGSDIFAIGSPIGFERTVSTGIVSAIRNNDSRLELQITAAASPGSSGGPVCNMAGEVVGITTYKLTDGELMNFAIASTETEKLKPGQFIYKDNSDEPHASSQVDAIYDFLADQYIKASLFSGRRSPEITVTTGDIGHLTGNYVLMQVLDNHSGLVYKINYTRTGIINGPIFHVSGMDFSKFVDHSRITFNRQIVFVRNNRYQYVTVENIQKSVPSLIAIDQESFDEAIERRNSRLKKIFSSRASNLLAELADARHKLRSLREQNPKYQKFWILTEKIRLYRPAADKPKIKEEIEQWEDELQELNINEQSARNHKSQIDRLNDTIKVLERKIEAIRVEVWEEQLKLSSP